MLKARGDVMHWHVITHGKPKRFNWTLTTKMSSNKSKLSSAKATSHKNGIAMKGAEKDREPLLMQGVPRDKQPNATLH
jgi:hypothetical protein